MDPKIHDPRPKSNRYYKGASVRFNSKVFDFVETQFLIDDNYVAEPPQVQISIENLNDNINENFLRKDLAKLGQIRTLEIIRHPVTKQHLGLAKVQFEATTVAQACVDTFNGKQVMGRQLHVYKDVRFTIIEKVKDEKLNPRPQHKTIPPSGIASAPSIAAAAPGTTVPSSSAALPVNPNAIYPPTPATMPPILPIGQQLPSSQTQSPMNIDFPLATPSSLTSSATTPAALESTNRQRLEDRIALLMKQPNCVLSTIVGPSGGQHNPAFKPTSNEVNKYDYTTPSYYHRAQSNVPLRALDRNRTESGPDFQNRENNSYGHHYRPYNNSKDQYHSNRTENNLYDQEAEEKAWNPEPKPIKEEPLNIVLTIKQIQEEVLPDSFEIFREELFQNLTSTIKKKLLLAHGYQCIEKNQTAFKAKQDQEKIERDRKLFEEHRRYELHFMTKARVERVTEAPRPRVNLIRQRTNHQSYKDEGRRQGTVDLRRVNRSSALVTEPDRRGSHNRSIDSDFSRSGSSSRSPSPSSSSASSSSRSSRSTSRSSSSIRSSSSSSFSSSASSFSGSSRSSSPSSFSGEEFERRKSSAKSQVKKEILNDESETLSARRPDEILAVTSLLDMKNFQKSSQTDDSSQALDHQPSVGEEDRAKIPTKGKKRKKHQAGIEDSENHVSKTIAASRKGSAKPARVEKKPVIISEVAAPRIFTSRSKDEKERIINDLIHQISDEDLNYLKLVHQRWEESRQNTLNVVPFGSDHANKAHLGLGKEIEMIENNKSSSHPKWWRGCSRCDVIKISERAEKVEETSWEDLTKAPIKSHVIQAATSSRRDQRGDQRRIALLNPGIDPVLLKHFTSNTLQMRAKNLRFSRSKIHKWGLFACEKIANGDAVIEYVGEKIRPSVADHREKVVYTNLPTHDGSSYFFRVDYDVIDATMKGNKARFINHCCNPNCIAKVIKHENGTNSIVIYAKQTINEDEEITYDYKFPIEETDQKIQCNCRAPNCRKFLN